MRRWQRRQGEGGKAGLPARPIEPRAEHMEHHNIQVPVPAAWARWTKEQRHGTPSQEVGSRMSGTELSCMGGLHGTELHGGLEGHAFPPKES